MTLLPMFALVFLAALGVAVGARRLGVPLPTRRWRAAIAFGIIAVVALVNTLRR